MVADSKDHSRVISFGGKYKSKDTFGAVYEKDPGYSMWCIAHRRTLTRDGKMFADYCLRRKKEEEDEDADSDSGATLSSGDSAGLRAAAGSGSTLKKRMRWARDKKFKAEVAKELKGDRDTVAGVQTRVINADSSTNTLIMIVIVMQSIMAMLQIYSIARH